MMTIITAATRQTAHEKLQDYLRYVSEEGALALMSGWTGVDFSTLPPDQPVRFDRRDAMTSALEAFTIADPERSWTVREIARHAAIGGRGPVIVGSFNEIADELQAWMAETDIDGFNLAYAVTPETFSDIVDLVVPELQRRGVYKLDYAPGTLREKIFAAGQARLPANHPAARLRRTATQTCWTAGQKPLPGAATLGCVFQVSAKIQRIRIDALRNPLPRASTRV